MLLKANILWRLDFLSLKLFRLLLSLLRVFFFPRLSSVALKPAAFCHLQRLADTGDAAPVAARTLKARAMIGNIDVQLRLNVTM